MRETVELRVAEEFAHLLFGETEGVRLADSVRKVTLSMSDPRCQRVGELQRRLSLERNKAFFYFSIIRRRYTLAELRRADWELYDLAADRVERNNLAARFPDIVKRLATEWNAWAERAHVDPWPGPRRLPWGDDAPPASPGRRD